MTKELFPRIKDWLSGTFWNERSAKFDVSPNPLSPQAVCEGDKSPRQESKVFPTLRDHLWGSVNMTPLPLLAQSSIGSCSQPALIP